MPIRKALGFSFLNSAKEIPESITPWLSHVDYVIAIDGSHLTPLPPGAKKPPKYSTDNSLEVLKQVCGDKLVYDKYSGLQIDKRQRYLDIAGELKCDMLIVWDSDDFLHPDYQDWSLFNCYLEIIAHEEDPSVYFMWAWIPSEEDWSKQWNVVKSNSWQKYARIHNKPGEQQYILNHFTFTKKEILEKHGIDKIGADYINHRNHKGHPYLIFADPEEMVEGVRFTTHRKHRNKSQLEYGNTWAWQEAREDDYRLLNYWRKSVGMELIPLEKRHYYDFPEGKLVFY